MKEIKELIQVESFKDSYIKLCSGSTITEEEKEYLLGCALLLLNKYVKEESNREYFELAYHIVLTYAVMTEDYEPLNDIALNYGFYPIVRFINQNKLLRKVTINQILYDYSLERYKNKNYIETYEQNITRKNIMNAEGDVCFIAPTSSGKSSVVSEHILHNSSNNKSLIIVPSKSLLSQTYMDMRKTICDRKIISHDEMYNGEEKFVGVLTQERTMRLLEKNDGLSIDYLYIDEAHNLFNNDSRNVLLARVIKMCRKNNPNIKIIYLSPFISDVENLLLKEQNGFDTIGEQRISYNIKEPQILEMKKDGEIYLYNRFLDYYQLMGSGYDLYSYLHKNSLDKNFVFLGSPRKIELFAKELYKNTDKIELTDELLKLKAVIEKNVHKDFLQSKMLEHGILYLHAKIPDVLKDYLEYQFKKIKGIRYLIANTVILEGINLPIDNLFILDVRSQNNNKLLNLIGRVNRLNNVFDNESGDLKKLLPTIHFINSNYYRGKMENRINKLYDRIDDEVTNPLLLNCNIDKLKGAKEKKERLKKRNEEILQIERIYEEVAEDEITKLKQLLIKNGVEQLVSIKQENVVKILKKISNFRMKANESEVLNIVKEILVDDIEVIDNSFRRLRNPAAIRYYNHFIRASRSESLSGQIESQLQFYKTQQKSGNYFMYIGQGFGECKGPYSEDSNMGDVYVDLRTKEDVEIVNLLVVKTKIEQDFLSYQYLRAVSFLYDIKLISDEAYNLEIYGTTNKKKIELLKLGITAGLLNVLEENDQIKNIEKDQYGNIQGNAKLKNFYMMADDYTKFEIGKYIKII